MKTVFIKEEDRMINIAVDKIIFKFRMFKI